MQRFVDCRVTKILLNEQYRMHPLIREFPSKWFYSSLLLDGQGISCESRYLPFHCYDSLGPYVYYDVEGKEESRSRGQTSAANLNEVRFVGELLKFFFECCDKEKTIYPSIGVITPYKRQARELGISLRRNLTPQRFKNIEIDTVDGFQGKEKDIIILSCVRSTEVRDESTRHYSIGFLNDLRRMNVALTRGKYSLWVVGDSRALNRDDNWNALIRNAKTRGLYIQVPKDGAMPPASKEKRLVPDCLEKEWSAISESLPGKKRGGEDNISSAPASKKARTYSDDDLEILPVVSKFK